MDKMTATSSKPLKIVFVTVADLPKGGGRTSRLRTLVTAFKDLGHHAEIWVEHRLTTLGYENQDPSKEAVGELAGIPYRYVLGHTGRSDGFSSIPGKIKAVRLMCESLRQVKPDLVVINTLSFYDTYPLTRVAREIGARTIQCYEDERLECMADETISFARRIFCLNGRLADHFCSRMADAMIVISTYLRNKYADYKVAPERLHLIPTIVDCDFWKLPPEPESSTTTFFYSGQFGEQDDMLSLIPALQRLQQEGHPFQLKLAGLKAHESPQVREFWEKASTSGIQKNLTFLGLLTQQQLKEEIAQANILLNLRNNSRYGSSGLSTKLSEYLATGRCVITTNIGDNTLYLKDGVSAVIVPNKPPVDLLTDTLRNLMSNSKLRKTLGSEGRKVAEQNFSIPVNSQKIARILQQIIPALPPKPTQP